MAKDASVFTHSRHSCFPSRLRGGALPSEGGGRCLCRCFIEKKGSNGIDSNLVSMKDENSCTATYSYDPADRLVDVTWQVPEPSGPSAERSLHLEYDPLGNLTKLGGPYESPVLLAGPPPGPLPITPESVWGFDLSGRPDSITLPGKGVYKIKYRTADGKTDTITSPSNTV